ncbi:MAG: thiamine-phosphate synthase [Deltaproteobacteria bacterium]|jgi:thiamine-phosphate pyrophosphorylase|nr:thiamine-phosphate synthase [Deltaproteobacteria bacterium]
MTPRPIHLYLVTDRTRTRGRPLLDVVEAALCGGVDAVQLREKDLSARELFDLACRLRRVCGRYGARLLINDRVDVALAAKADGVHLPVNSLLPADARLLLGTGGLIGASAHSLAEARAAAEGGADFVLCGPVFDTPSKRAYGPPVGLEVLGRVTGALKVPVIAIGGITADSVDAVGRQGARGVAVIGAILEGEDPEAAARAIKSRLRAALP